MIIETKLFMPENAIMLDGAVPSAQRALNFQL
jgi:hypothetical protein